MALGKVGKALNKGTAKGRPKKTTDEGEAREKAVAVGESIVVLEDSLAEMEDEEEKVLAKLMATKLGQQLQEIRDGIKDGKKRMKGLEKEAIPLIQVVEPDTMCLELDDGATLTVDEKIGSKSSANTKGALESYWGEDKAKKYWDQLEGKRTPFLALDRPETD